MPWEQVVGHRWQAESFRRSGGSGRLPSAFLFAGPGGVGKHHFALELAKALLCPTGTSGDGLEACGECESCAQVTAGTHPDLEQVARPAGKATIPLALLIGDDEHRMREGLCHRISLTPFYGRRKVAIIDDADYLAAEGANCLLKTLEEPPPHCVIILIATAEQRQLPTIRSRCQIVRFSALADDELTELLLKLEWVADADQAARIAELSGGSLDTARDWLDEEFSQFSQRLIGQLSDPRSDPLQLQKELQAYVDAAGKEAPPRRLRLRKLIATMAAFYRQALRTACGQPLPGGVWAAEVDQALSGPLTSQELIAERLERCLEADEHVLRNGNLSNVIECWLDDLARPGSIARWVGP